MSTRSRKRGAANRSHRDDPLLGHEALCRYLATKFVLMTTASEDTIGTEIDTVWVEIDYAILQHFSKHLYTSPSKAVEELVTNGYDALATRVDVYLPGVSAESALLVWDDGSSMDIEALKRLWWIARSPKLDNGEERVATSPDGSMTRRMVGKFGIGKLASYAVGDRLAHLCRRDDEYLLVQVNYNDAPSLDAQTDGKGRGFPTPILRLDENQAREYAESLFRVTPDNFGALFDRSHWTIAIVDEVKADSALSPGRLKWVLGNGMPVRPDFEVFVDGDAVVPTAMSGAFATWTFEEPALQEAIRTNWTNAKAAFEVDGEPTFGVDDPTDGSNKGRAWVELDGLGKVYGEVKLFEVSLKDGRAGEHGRSEGFFIYVRERLLNPDDPKLLLNDPSFGAFNRMHAVLYADGLDAELLADRERLGESPSARALKTLQQAVYLASRQRLEKLDEADQQASALRALLPMDSRDFFRQPLTALAISRPGPSGERFNATRAHVVQETGPESDPLMTIRPETSELVLNEGHPLFAAARRRLGSGAKAAEALRLIELLAVSDTLLTGYLLDVGLSDDLVDRITEWRDGQVRSLALSYEKRPEEVVAELEASSYLGKSQFERAIAQMFRLLGFVAQRNGEKGEEDVLIVAPIGRSEDKFTAEGKGKRAGKGAKDKMANDDAEISGAAAHAAAIGASFAIVVARDFQGFAVGDGSQAAVLQECRCQTPPVSIVTVEALVALYRAVQENHYPLTTMLPILAAIEPPAEKLARIAAIRRPLDNFDIPDLLERVWMLQQGVQSGMAIPVNQVKASRPDWKAMTKEAFDRALYGLEELTGGLLIFVADEYAVELAQSPDIILAALPAGGKNQPQPSMTSGTNS